MPDPIDLIFYFCGMEPLYLHMAIIGCTPPGRFTEQHDVFFGIAKNMKELIPAIREFWPEAEGRMHVDAWRRVTRVNGYAISVMPLDGITATNTATFQNLYFLNLGGYKPGEFEEYHYKMLAVAPDPAGAIQQGKSTAFYRHCDFEGATSHIDDKYGIDVDDLHVVKDILAPQFKQHYTLLVEDVATTDHPDDELHIGYFKLDKL
jgi:hypothetical protein